MLVDPRVDPTTKAYIARRVSEGKSVREARRCLKRATARQLFKLLERSTQAPAAIAPPPHTAAA
jgi:isocitrate lyase